MEIIRKEKDYIVCVKPAGALSTDEEGGMPSLIRQALNDERADVRCVHRLDRVVGGLMVYARNASAAADLSRQITEHTFNKEYMTVVHGCPEEKYGRMDDLLFRDSAENKTYVVKRMRKGVREAALEYEVLGEKDGLSLVRIRLLTGRTHQIRAQFSSRSMPLAGDRKYGAGEEDCDIALWSCALSFKAPGSGKTQSFTLSPPDAWPWNIFGIQQPGRKAENVSPPKKAEKLQCPYAKKCGGCQLQNLDYQAQLALKQKRLKELLGQFGHIEPIIPMEYPWHYRNKAHAAFGKDGKGKTVCGIYQPASHKIVPVDSCLIEDETADAIIADVRKMMPDFKIEPFDERRGTGFLRHVLVKRSPSTGQVMLVLVAAGPVFSLQKPFLKELLKRHPEITTVILNINDAFTPVVLGRQEKVIFGPGYIEDRLCGYTFRISAKSFYQVNPRQTETLYSTAVEFAGLAGKETVLDAYCGTGTIGITASSRCAKVAGVEINKDAVRDAIINAKTNGIQNVWFTCGDAGQYMEGLAAEKAGCDVVFMDPPRSGSDERFLSSLVKMGPKRIVYISCGPDTLARDLKFLTARGYSVKKIQPVDMFPQTEHVETVVLMSRVKE